MLNYREKDQNVLEHYMLRASCSRHTSRYTSFVFNLYFQARLCMLLNIFTLQLGTVHLCRSVIRSIETARIFDFEEFPKRDKVRIELVGDSFFSPFGKLVLRTLVFYCHYMILQVTYMYYTGRLEVFNENFPAVSN